MYPIAIKITDTTIRKIISKLTLIPQDDVKVMKETASNPSRVYYFMPAVNARGVLTGGWQKIPRTQFEKTYAFDKNKIDHEFVPVKTK